MGLEITELENGFRVISERMPGLKSAVVGVWVDVGGRFETPQQNGVAHFLEHMAFKGTDRRSSLDIASAIENVGGYVNAYTSKETTAYYAGVLEENVGLAIDVLADILRNPLLNTADIDSERRVILQEIGQTLDTPDDIIFDWLQETAYPKQAIGRPILGAPKIVNQLGRADLQQFITENYAPSRMILSAAGAVNHDEIVALAERFFGDMRPAPATVCERGIFKRGDRRVIKELEQAHFALALPSLDNKDERRYVAQIYALALGGGMSSRLFQEVREKRGLCYSIFAHSSAYADTGMFSIYSGTGADRAQELVSTVIDELRRIGDDFSDAELARARAQIKAGTLMALERPINRAERQARALSIWGYVPTLDEIINAIEGVSLDMVRQFAQERCSDGRVVMALYGQEPLNEIADIETLSRRLAA